MNLSERPKLFEEDNEIMQSNPLLTATFFLKSDHSSPVVLVLTPKSVFFHLPDNKQNKQGFMITFDTIFQVLRPKYQPEEKIFGTPTGLKFIAPNCEAQ
jgi:hypothetical protein